MAGCQNYGPFWGTLIIRCRLIIASPKWAMILTTIQMFNPKLVQGFLWVLGLGLGFRYSFSSPREGFSRTPEKDIICGSHNMGSFFVVFFGANSICYCRCMAP